ncbi:hypothetical protein TSUD_94090 [Trifolium subterraneum]|uniref:S-locus glycoprotein domain-containing protein n=1 Tax=Trifolium subterraneum TaxID=3900 RepID=A0A2Z6NAC7_TRISU|nr:hypothetical protein TSUD_94090 [Trifolium subterraneum]
MNGSEKVFRIGPWNGLHFSALPEQVSNSFIHYEIVSNDDDIFYSYSIEINTVISKVVVDQTKQRRYVWDEQEHNWRTYVTLPKDFCDTYGLCGPYGNCIMTQQQSTGKSLNTSTKGTTQRRKVQKMTVVKNPGEF